MSQTIKKTTLFPTSLNPCMLCCVSISHVLTLLCRQLQKSFLRPLLCVSFCPSGQCQYISLLVSSFLCVQFSFPIFSQSLCFAPLHSWSLTPWFPHMFLIYQVILHTSNKVQAPWFSWLIADSSISFSVNSPFLLIIKLLCSFPRFRVCSWVLYQL